MPNFRIALGYETEHRRSEPTILAAGYDQAALQKAVDEASLKFGRFEFGTFAFLRTARRTLGAVPSEIPVIEEMSAAEVLTCLTTEELMIEIERREGGLAAALKLLPENSTPNTIAPVPPTGPEPAVAPEPVAEAPAGEDETSPASGEDDAPSLLPRGRKGR